MDKFILKILLRITKIFASKDVDFEKLEAIVSTKLLMDNRRKSLQTAKNKNIKNPMLFALIMYGIMGSFIGIMAFLVDAPLVVLIIYHSYLMFMMAMTLITDFSAVLLDTTESQVILPRPVNSKTFFLSRMLHILTYLLQLTLALCLVPIVCYFFAYGFAAGLASIVTSILIVVFSVFLTYILYGVMLRFTSEQKLKDIIGGFQIFMTVFFAIAYQIVPRIINLDEAYRFNLHWYSYLLPPVWASVAVEAFSKTVFDGTHLLMIALIVLVPIICVYAMMKWLAPYFSKKIGALASAGSTDKPLQKNRQHRKGLSAKLSPIVCRSNAEQAGFEQVWKITGRDKSFQMQLYPSLAYVFIFLFIIFFRRGASISSIMNNPDQMNVVWLLYMPIMGATTALELYYFYTNFEAGWVYQSSPIETPGKIIAGACKALLIKYLLPFFIILASIALYIYGPKVLPDIALALCSNVLIFYIMAAFKEKSLPFSRQLTTKQQTGKFASVMLRFMAIGLLIGLHYLALLWRPIVFILIPITIVGLVLLMVHLKKTEWNKIVF